MANRQTGNNCLFAFDNDYRVDVLLFQRKRQLIYRLHIRFLFNSVASSLTRSTAPSIKIQSSRRGHKNKLIVRVNGRTTGKRSTPLIEASILVRKPLDDKWHFPRQVVFKFRYL